jgi:cytochrome c
MHMKMLVKMMAPGAIFLTALVADALAQSIVSGRERFNLCIGCHEIGPGAKNKVGPVLNGLAGRRAGIVEGYTYSEAMRSSGITWDEETFVDYIMHPQHRIPGVKMTFAGTKNKEAAEDLWAYTRTFAADGSQLAVINPTASK